jgi:ABC-type phosphate transport system substrate-binding protein
MRSSIFNATAALKGCATVVAAAVIGVTVAAQTIQINGAGATFPNPIYSKWFDEYGKAHSNILSSAPCCSRSFARSASSSSASR